MTTKQFLKNRLFFLKRKNYTLLMLLFISIMGFPVCATAQFIEPGTTYEVGQEPRLLITGDNTEITVDGDSNSFFEFDMMLSVSVPMASGANQFYVRYNNDCFGENLYDSTDAESTIIRAGGSDTASSYEYIWGRAAFGGAIPLYNLIIANNRNNILSYAVLQTQGKPFYIDDLPTGTPGFTLTPEGSPYKLAHFKLPINDASVTPVVEVLTDGTVVNAANEQWADAADTNVSPANQFTPVNWVIDLNPKVIWTGATDSDWATATNWKQGAVPATDSDVLIGNTATDGVTNFPTISNAVTVNSIRVKTGATLIANAAVTGNVTYDRRLFTEGWHLISSPVSGETIADVIADSGSTLDTGTGSNIGLAPYNNAGTASWTYLNASSVGNFDSGQGYSVKLTDNLSNVRFTGTINSSDVSVAVTNGSESGYNLIGNPFTAYVNSNTFLTANTSSLSEETIWVWNETAYEARNSTNPLEIAPAQGFFVLAGSAGNVSFATSNQSHQATNTFLKTAPRTNFELSVDNGSEKSSAKVFYIKDKTRGFDNGYDSSMFGGVSHDFAVFTELLSDSKGERLSIQTLPDSDYNTMVIPVGLIAAAGEEVTFSVNPENLPEGFLVYLEDKVNDTMSNLSEGNHKVTLQNALNGTGQFYIHTTSRSLSNEDITKDNSNINIYKSSAKAVTVSGLQQKATMKVFSILGEELVSTGITPSNGVSKTIALDNLSTGVYIVRLTSRQSNVTRKIILE